MLAPMWEDAGGKIEEELMLLKREWRWESAENGCQDQGGHLASIATSEKQKSTLRFLKKAEETGGWLTFIWLGGSDAQSEGNWTWSDNSVWGFDNWYPGNPDYLKSPEPNNGRDGLGRQGKREDCLKMKDPVRDGTWHDEDCKERLKALCQKDTHVFKGKLNRTWTIGSETVPQEIEFVWEAESKVSSKRTGLSISWRSEEDLPNPPDPVYATENQFFIGTTNLVRDLKEKGSSETEIWTKVIAYKMSMIEARLFDGRCEMGQLKQGYQRKLLETFLQEINQIGSINYQSRAENEISDEDLVLGFEIYLFLTFCHENFLVPTFLHTDNMDLVVESEALKLFIFYSDTVDKLTPQDILQTFVNMMSSSEVKFDENKKGIGKMLEELTAVLSPAFSRVLAHLYTESELEQLANSTKMNFLTNQSSDQGILPGEKKSDFTIFKVH